MNLKLKSLLLITPLIIFPILLIGIVAFNKLQATSISRLETRATTLLDQISRHTSHEEHVALSNLKLLSEHHIVKQYALTHDESIRYSILLPPMLALFQNLKETMPGYLEIKYIDLNGFEDAYLGEDGIDNKNDNVLREPFFVDFNELDEEHKTYFIKNDNTNEYAVLVIKKIIIKDGTFDGYGVAPKLRGFLAILINMDELKKEIAETKISKSGYLSVLDRNGSIIYGSDANRLFLKNVSNVINLNSNAWAGRKEDFVYSDDYKANIYWRSFIGETRLVGVLPEKDLIDDGYDLGKTVFLLTVVVVVAVVLFVLASLRFLILKPIDVLNHAVNELKNGNMDVNVGINTNDEIGSLASSFADMSKALKKTHDEVNFIANHDGLTGLPNRSMFVECLNNTIAIAEERKYKFILLFIDLDNFKETNDTFGHQGGDEVLIETAARLKNAFDDEELAVGSGNKEIKNIVSRFGGDEFVILLNDIGRARESAAAATKVLSLMCDPVIINNENVYINCSVGVSAFPSDSQCGEELIKFADLAMYHAKNRGKNNYQFYSDGLIDIMYRRSKILSRLRSALEKGQFFVNYQPKLDTFSGELVGLEALLRWEDPEEGLISPEMFIPIAEESGIIHEITEWVLMDVLAQTRDWMNEYGLCVPVAVNISGLHFKRHNLLGIINGCLDRTELPPNMLEIELTESTLMSEVNYAVKIISMLKDKGVRVSLDDFGTGYSSLSCLKNLPIDTLKIDKEFTKEICTVGGNCYVIDAIIALGHALNLSVVAEGVETLVQHEYLKKRRCNIVQGFLYSRPVSVTDVTTMLMQPVPAGEYSVGVSGGH